MSIDNNGLRNASMILGLLMVTAPMATKAAEQSVQQVATSDANQDRVVCRSVEIPGSHVKERLCATAAQWYLVRSRVGLLRANPAASIGAYWPSVQGSTSGFGTVATQSSFQR